MKQKQSISAIKKGMNRNSHPSQLSNLEVSLAVNVNTNSETGDSVNYQLEPSDRYGVKFPTGYKVIGFKNDILKDRTYYFLTNTEESNSLNINYRRSSIGYVDYSKILNNDFNNSYQLENCGDCEQKNILNIPLELQVQIPSQVYVELVHDRCITVIDLEDKGLNFNINSPIKKIEIKQEKLGTNLYWNDWRNHFRYLQVGRIEEALQKKTFDYLHTLDIACQDPLEIPCLNVNKLLVAPLYTRLRIEAQKSEIGGNLKMGSYEFWVAYCDLNANNISDYSTPTNPISIWDENNYIQNQTETDDFTNYAIKLKVHNLDIKRFKYYKVAVVERNNVNNTQSVFLVGVFPTTDDSVSYTHSSSSNDDLYTTRGNVSINKRITFQELLSKKPRYKRMKGTMVTDNRLIGYGLEEEVPLNLQPAVNLFSSLIKAQTAVAKEDLYKSSIATSKYKYYTRNEVQPLALRLLYDDGGYSPNFTFIARPSNNYDTKLIADSNPNSASLIGAKGACATSDRKQRWQIFNTAEEIETDNCFDLEANSTEMPAETTEKTCVINVESIPTNTAIIELEAEYYDLKSYINDNLETITLPTEPNYSKLGIFLKKTYPQTCTPYYDQKYCTPPVLNIGSIKVNVLEVVGEKKEFEYKTESEYVKTQAPKFCDILEREGNYFKRDIEFENLYSSCVPDGSFTFKKQTVYVRNTDIANETCNNAEEVPIISSSSGSFSSVVLNYEANVALNNLALDNFKFLTPIVSPGFLGTVHNKAKFFKIKKNNRKKIIFEITKIKGGCSTSDKFGMDYFSGFQNREIRYNIYNNCSGSIHLGGGLIDLNIGLLKEIDVSLFPSTFYIAIDTKIIPRSAPTTCPNEGTRLVYYIVPPCESCFGIYQREREPKSVQVSWTSIKLEKQMSYDITCTSFLPKVNDCDPIPYKKYKTAYWQSTDKYPDNKELYDSSKLKISKTNLNLLDKIDINDFLSYYSNAKLIKLTTQIPKYTFIVGNEYFILQKSNELFTNQTVNKIFTASVAQELSWTNSLVYLLNTLDGNIVLSTTKTNFVCAPIRHPKLPDNTIAPFIIDNTSYKKGADSLIFPIGFNFDSKIVKIIIDTAYENKYITKKQKDKIVGWEILKGDNSINKSVKASGILIDVNKYTKNNQTIHFSNFPFNDLGVNKFITDEGGNLIDHKEGSSKNNYFTFISPDMLLTRPVAPTEMCLQGYLQGTADISFADVEEHSKWTVLGEKTYQIADTLAIAEFALELAIGGADLTKEVSIFFGTSNGGNIGALIAAGIYFVANGIGSFVKLGKHRYEWLDIFRNLGRTTNHASFQYGVAKHNKIIKIGKDDNGYLRRLSVKKQINKGDYTFVDENTGEQIKLNHTNRESSLFLSVGKHYINYPSEYINLDNNKVNSKSSNFVLSEVGCGSDTRNVRDVANPYVQLKDYIPNQWGDVDSIKWLTTNYIFDINEDTMCKTIFGGTQMITRFSWRVKVPFFMVDAITIADKTPFIYSKQSNFAKTRFFCDYEYSDDSIFTYSGIPFPDVRSTYNFDCITGQNDFYVSSPSKFYLFTHGITDFLVESEINCNFRYGRKEPKDQLLANQNLSKHLQEINLPISEPNTFFYNNTYSLPVSNSPFFYLNKTYNKEEVSKIAMMPNAWQWSEKDNSENDGVDSWLVNRPLNYKEEETNNGKLIDLTSIESNQFLARYENELQLYNQPNPYADAINTQNKELGTGILYNKPVTFKATSLGFAGTQNSEIVSTPFGHFWCDAKRGKIFKVDQNGQGLEVISENIGNQPSGMTSWFREHLPFKILRYFPNIDIDNKFKGLGLNMWWDDRENRLFITKRDYIPTVTTCLGYREDIGFYNTCIQPEISCSQGYTYNTVSKLCEKVNPCISNLIARVYYTNVAPYENHACNRARFNLRINGINVGIVNLNNAGGLLGEQIDEKNIIPNGSLSSRETYLTVSQQNINTILAVNSKLAVTLECRDLQQSGGCHSDIAGLDLFQNNLLIFSGNLGINTFVNFDPCQGQPQIITQPPIINENITPIYFDNTELFKDVSWTIAYKPTEGTWSSYFSFYPDYSPFHNNFFQSGYNWAESKGTVWNHLLNRNSFCVFQGKKHAPILEFAIANENVNKILNSVALNLESRYYINDWESVIDRDKSFKNMFIYNGTNNTGMLELNAQKSLNDIRRYPITEGNIQKILYTAVEDKQNINYFFNRIINEQNNIPMFVTDKNNIFKNINNSAINFSPRKVLERMKGEYFIIHLEGIQDTRFNLILKNTINNETIYQ